MGDGLGADTERKTRLKNHLYPGAVYLIPKMIRLVENISQLPPHGGWYHGNGLYYK